MDGKPLRCSSTTPIHGASRSSPSPPTRSPRTARRPWKSAATDIWPNPASLAPSSPRCSAFWGRPMDVRRESDRARILIVDDNPDSLEILRVRLESWGYRTQTAADGEEALKKIETQPPDLILLDIMMPRVDGMEVARRVKNNPELPFIPIIMETALD